MFEGVSRGQAGCLAVFCLAVLLVSLGFGLVHSAGISLVGLGYAVYWVVNAPEKPQEPRAVSKGRSAGCIGCSLALGLVYLVVAWLLSVNDAAHLWPF